MLMMKCTRMFHARNDVIHVRTLWSQKVVSNVSNVYKVRRSTSCVSKNVIYTAFCLNCLKQGVGSTVDWKPRLRIFNHFTDVCSYTDDPSRNIKLVIVDQLNNTNSLSPDEIDDLLLQKERLWIPALVTIYERLNSSHDWNRKRRTERLKQR